ncbi:putative initiation factor eIF-4 gamma, MA3 [Helianthus anomalus]
MGKNKGKNVEPHIHVAACYLEKFRPKRKTKEYCSHERSYLVNYGLLGQRLCMINKVHQENFEMCFVQLYSMIHRLETNKLRNVAKFFAHLLAAYALPWHLLAYIRLTEEDKTSSSRIFNKILSQELSRHLAIRILYKCLTDPRMQDDFESLFPRDNPQKTRFSFNFFTCIGLGGITAKQRQYLKAGSNESRSESDHKSRKKYKKIHSIQITFSMQNPAVNLITISNR